MVSITSGWKQVLLSSVVLFNAKLAQLGEDVAPNRCTSFCWYLHLVEHGANYCHYNHWLLPEALQPGCLSNQGLVAAQSGGSFHGSMHCNQRWLLRFASWGDILHDVERTKLCHPSYPAALMVPLQHIPSQSHQLQSQFPWNVLFNPKKRCAATERLFGMIKLPLPKGKCRL